MQLIQQVISDSGQPAVKIAELKQLVHADTKPGLREYRLKSSDTPADRDSIVSENRLHLHQERTFVELAVSENGVPLGNTIVG